MKNLSIIKPACITLVLASLLAGCAQNPGLHSNLIPSQTQAVAINSVQHISLNGPFAINLHTGNKAVSQMTLFGTQQQLSHVSIKHDGQNLVINDHNFTNSTAPVQVTITDPDLRSLEINHAQSAMIDAGKKGYFDLQVQDVKQLTFKGNAVLPNIKLNDSQSLIIHDQVTVHNLYRSGQGNIVLSHAQGNNINITNSSGGGVYIDGSSLGFNQIKQTGNGEIQINSTQPLQQLTSVSNSNNGQIQIHAPRITSQQLNITGNDQTQTTISNINTQYIQAQLTDSAQLNISGNSALTKINLDDHAQLLGRNLVNQTIYMTSADLSYATFTVDRSLFASAIDQSLIEYAGHPEMQFVRTTKYATILSLNPPK